MKSMATNKATNQLSDVLLDKLEQQIEYLLSLYARSLGGNYQARLDYPSTACLGKYALTNYMAGEDDSAIYYDIQLKSIGTAVYACVDSLPKDNGRALQKAAIDYKVGLCRIWPHQEDWLEIYDCAKKNLMVLFIKRDLISY